ncbi:MAG: hypothetical protein KatS3mg060_3019 [Dehalococcoidia bacterium]|nr:MAG: hypothetical protein KatS3mg060_3019 [Dehalococcoidia bacterium]
MRRSLMTVMLLLSIGALAPAVPAVESQLIPEPLYVYQDIPDGYDFPAPSHRLLAAIYANDRQAIREHAWNLWAGLTAPSLSVVNGQRLPIFETWYSADELFEDAAAGKDPLRGPRDFARFFELPSQHLIGRPPDTMLAANFMSFVSYNQAGARHLWENGLFRRATLVDLNNRFNATNQPIEARTIPPFPNDAVAIKVVYGLIKRPDSPQSDNGLTALPIWRPTYPPPADSPPIYLTWLDCVAVDPAGRYPAGSLQPVNCNGTAEAPRVRPSPVVRLNDFYSFQLTTPDQVQQARKFMREPSVGQPEERFVTNAGQVPEIGDFVVLLAMHVTTKEIDDWTWQTFWWSPNPDSSPFGDNRTAKVRGPFRNFEMCTAYDMVLPREPDGGPAICFNPHLEADLGVIVPVTPTGEPMPRDLMNGIKTNCMACHVRAGYPSFDRNDPTAANFGPVRNEGYVPPNDPIFARIVRTDFLWSVAIRSQP